MRFFKFIFYMSAILTTMPTFSLEKSPKVVVIGAGIAGLTTAYRLQQGGMDVELYEARGRVGGRIFTATVNGRIAELGGQCISDGGEALNLNRLIDEFGLQRTTSRSCLRHSYFNGKDLISVREILKERKMNPQTLKQQLHELASTRSNMQEVLQGIIDPHDPLFKIFSVRLAAYEGGTIEKLSPLYSETLYYMLLGGVCSVYQGSPEKETYINLVTITGGNASLPQKMGEALGPKLHLSMPLTKVAQNQDDTFQLTFKNGDEALADILVLAIPCSVYEQIAFEEGTIPSEKLAAIQSVKYGANAKIMVPFTALPADATGLVSDEIVSFFDTTQQILTVYYTGEASEFSSETITDSYTQATPMIEKGFGKNFLPAEVPTYAKDQPNLSYEGPVGYSWPNDPYARGTYSYIASGQEHLLTATLEHNAETFKTLFAPIQHRLYFAGEHASILAEVPGTMEAACESGERTARAILSSWEQNASNASRTATGFSIQGK